MTQGWAELYYLDLTQGLAEHFYYLDLTQGWAGLYYLDLTQGWVGLYYLDLTQGWAGLHYLDLPQGWAGLFTWIQPRAGLEFTTWIWPRPGKAFLPGIVNPESILAAAPKSAILSWWPDVSTSRFAPKQTLLSLTFQGFLCCKLSFSKGLSPYFKWPSILSLKCPIYTN